MVNIEEIEETTEDYPVSIAFKRVYITEYGIHNKIDIDAYCVHTDRLLVIAIRVYMIFFSSKDGVKSGGHRRGENRKTSSEVSVTTGRGIPKEHVTR